MIARYGVTYFRPFVEFLCLSGRCDLEWRLSSFYID